MLDLFFLLARVRGCDVPQASAQFLLSQVPTDRLNQYLTKKGTFNMKDEGTTLQKLKEVTLKATSTSKSTNGPGIIHVENTLSVHIAFTFVDNLKNKAGKADKTDSIFKYDLDLKGGKLAVTNVAFEIGSAPFKVDIELTDSGTKDLSAVMDQLNKSFLSTEYIKSLQEQLKGFPNFKPLTLNIKKETVTIDMVTDRLSKSDDDAFAITELNGKIEGIEQACGSMAFPSFNSPSLALYAQVVAQSVRKAFQAKAFQNLLYSRDNWTIPLFGYSCLQLSLVSDAFLKKCSDPSATVLLKCSLLPGYSLPDANKQFKAQWACSILSQTQSDTYFSLNVTANYKLAFVTSNKLTAVLTKADLAELTVASSNPNEYQVNDIYTAKLMVNSALNATLGSTLAATGELPLPGLSNAQWSANFLVIESSQVQQA